MKAPKAKQEVSDQSPKKGKSVLSGGRPGGFMRPNQYVDIGPAFDKAGKPDPEGWRIALIDGQKYLVRSAGRASLTPIFPSRNMLQK